MERAQGCFLGRASFRFTQGVALTFIEFVGFAFAEQEFLFEVFA